jgi:hypothetical protein
MAAIGQLPDMSLFYADLLGTLQIPEETVSFEGVYDILLFSSNFDKYSCLKDQISILK